MKDIYSPLDIDEAWDDMAPVSAAGPAMGGEGATAVAVKPEADTNMATEGSLATSEANTAIESPVSALPPSTEGYTPATDSSEDAAYDFAGVNTNDGKLNYNEISPTATDDSTDMTGVGTMPDAMATEDEAPKAEFSADSTKVEAEAPVINDEKATATPIPVIDMNEASKASEPAGVQAGESFAPVETPAEDRFAGLKVSEAEPAEETATAQEAPKSESAPADLPVSPAENKQEMEKEEPAKAPSKVEMKFDAGETAMTDDAEKHLEKVKATATAQSEELAKIISDLEAKRDDLEEAINDKNAEKQGVEKQIDDAKSQKEKIDQIASM